MTPTLCTDPRCVASQRCQRAEYERYGKAPGENYGPRCVPVPAFGLARGAELVYALGVEEGERRATERIVAWLNAEAERVDCGHIEALLQTPSNAASTAARRSDEPLRLDIP